MAKMNERLNLRGDGACQNEVNEPNGGGGMPKKTFVDIRLLVAS